MSWQGLGTRKFLDIKSLQIFFSWSEVCPGMWLTSWCVGAAIRPASPPHILMERLTELNPEEKEQVMRGGGIWAFLALSRAVGTPWTSLGGPGSAPGGAQAPQTWGLVLGVGSCELLSVETTSLKKKRLRATVGLQGAEQSSRQWGARWIDLSPGAAPTGPHTHAPLLLLSFCCPQDHLGPVRGHSPSTPAGNPAPVASLCPAARASPAVPAFRGFPAFLSQIQGIPTWACLGCVSLG